MELLSVLIKKKSGQLLIEALMGLAIASIILPALFLGFFATKQGKAQQNQRIQAIALMKEAQEAARSVREKGWSNFTTDGNYHPQIIGNTWNLQAGNEIIEDNFTRTVTITSVQRDANGEIVLSGGTVDTSTKKVEVSVSWTQPYTSSVRSVMYITRFLGNGVFTQTTQSDFNAGLRNGTIVQSTSGSPLPDDGEVIFASAQHGDWCQPSLTLSAIDLPKNGIANALYAIEGKAFAGTGDNASGVSYASVSISNSDPPSAQLDYTFDGYKTNDVFGEQNYAFIATDNNFKEVVIININSVVNGKYQEAGYFNAPGNGSGNSIFVSGQLGFVTSGNKLYSFNLSSKTGERQILDPDGITLPGIGNKIYVVGNYVYVAIGGSNIALQIVDATNPSNLFLSGSANIDPLNLDSGESGRAVFVNTTGDRAYLASSASSALPEFHIINTSSKNGNLPIISSFDTNGMNPKALSIVPKRAIIVGIGGQEYQVLNISNESSLSSCGGLQIDTGVNGIATVREADGDLYAYIITGDQTSEFKIIEGGPGGVYADEGTFESSAINLGSNTAFNRFSVASAVPTDTDLKFQIASAQPATSCVDATYTYVGPDGTDQTYFSSSGGPMFIPGIIFNNPAQCFRYKAYFSSQDYFLTPTIFDVSVYYSL
jgi:type II secretory pathway pseudopilin PulG